MKSIMLINSVVRRVFSGVLLFGVATCGALADVVTDWNAIMQATVFVPPTSPFSQTRSAAITQLAVFEAVNAIIGDYEPYIGTIVAPSGASPEAAAAAAAHRVLVELYPGSVGALGVALGESLSDLPDGPSKDNGIAVGVAAAEAMLALRSADGASTANSVPYTPDTNPGDWQSTGTPAVWVGWGLVETFGIKSGAQFRAAPPPLLQTGIYARDFEEVKQVGRVDSGSRPADGANVAQVYSRLTFVNLYHPIARELSALHGKTLSENARLFALLAMAGADGLISSMEGKYYYNLWRPLTAIRAADTDDNAKTVADPTWTTYIGTPPYPSYPSNHASGSGASIAVLEDAFGKRGHSFSVSTPAWPGVVLNYTTFEQIGADIDDARVFSGIHFRFDQVAGRKQGTQVGHYILQHELRPMN
jgi:hypothetical protein